MALTADPKIVGLINKCADDILENIVSDNDVRKAITYIPEYVQKVRAVAELYDTEENRFTSWIVWNIFSTVQQLDGHTDEWYKDNKEHLDKIKNEMKEYVKNLKEGFSKEDFNIIIESSKKFFFILYGLGAKLTSDRKK